MCHPHEVAVGLGQGAFERLEGEHEEHVVRFLVRGAREYLSWPAVGRDLDGGEGATVSTAGELCEFSRNVIIKACPVQVRVSQQLLRFL